MDKDDKEKMFDEFLGPEESKPTPPNPEDKPRKKRGKNKNSAKARDRVDHYKSIYTDFVSPFDYLLLTMNGRDSQGNPVNIDIKERINCAKAAVQYTNPKLSAVEVEAESNEDTLDIKETTSRIEELLQNPSVRALLGENGEDNEQTGPEEPES